MSLYDRVISEAANPERLEKLLRLWRAPGTPGEGKAAGAAYKRITGKDPESAPVPPTSGSSSRRGPTRSADPGRGPSEWFRQQAEREKEREKSRAPFAQFDKSSGKDEVQHHIDHWHKHRAQFKGGDWYHGDPETAEQHRRAAYRQAHSSGDLESLGRKGAGDPDPSSHTHLRTAAELYGGTAHSSNYHDQLDSRGRPLRKGGAGPKEGVYHFRDEEAANAFVNSMRSVYKDHPVSIANPEQRSVPGSHSVKTRFGRRSAQAKRWR